MSGRKRSNRTDELDNLIIHLHLFTGRQLRSGQTSACSALPLNQLWDKSLIVNSNSDPKEDYDFPLHYGLPSSDRKAQ